MNRLLSSIISKSLVIALFVFFTPSTYAAPGCCSHHGGVSGCNAATNHQSCKDGTSSPSCLCNGEKAAKTTKVKTSSTTSTTATTTAAPAATTTTATTTTKSTKGCCAKHGGVSKCDAASGYQMCKDGTRSSSCKC